MADDFCQIWVGDDKIGLRGLKEAIEEIARSYAGKSDEEIREALLDRLSEKNYIADCARKEYGEALLKEFKKSLGQAHEDASVKRGLSVVVLGPGCSECNRLEQNVKQALTEMCLQISVEHVTDIKEIANYGLVRTPALVINGTVVVSGTVPSVKKIKELLEKH